MKTKVLSIAVVERDGKVLMRKKPNGSVPYEETWYMFGGEVADGKDPVEAAIEIVKRQTGVTIALRESLGWDSEVKKDLDGETKQFVYLDGLYDFVEGELQIGEGENIEKLEWVAIGELDKYDLVPPSVVLFKKLGWVAD